MELTWVMGDQELYTCCWDELRRQLGKAVAETVLTQTFNVNITLSFKRDTNVTASIKVTEDSEEVCIAIAINLRPNLVSGALESQRLLETQANLIRLCRKILSLLRSSAGAAVF